MSPLLVLAAAAAPGVHGAHRHHPPAVAPRVAAPLPPAESAPSVWVYGYYAYWAGEPEDIPWDRLTHVAVFSVDLESDGTVSGTWVWDEYGPRAVALAAPAGVRVHLTLTCFDDGVMAAVLPSESRRATAVDALGTLVDEQGADGVSVDCEGLDAEYKADFVSFVRELKARVPEVTVAMPSVDWNGAYDYDELALASDGLFIMGYGYHWSGGNPGPVAPLHGGDPWSDYSLAWTVDDYRTWGATDDKLVVGLPLYGYDWPSTSTDVPGTATGDGDAVTMVGAVAQAEETGRTYDTVTDTPYTFPDSASQLWYDDTDSLRVKIRWAVDEGLLGIGFWALNYEGGDAEFWDMVAEETTREDGDDTADTGDSVEDTGQPPLSFREGRPPGDIVAIDSLGGCSAAGSGAGTWWVAVLAIRRRGVRP